MSVHNTLLALMFVLSMLFTHCHVPLHDGCLLLARLSVMLVLLCHVQVNSIVLAAAVTFPTTIDSTAASTAAHSLYSALNTNPGSVYTASSAALLTSATVAITNASLASSLVTPRPSATLPTGVAPVQFLLSGDSGLTCDPTCVAVAGRKLLASEQAGGLMTKLQDRWRAVVGQEHRHRRGRGLVALPCCTTAPPAGSTQVAAR